MSLIASLLEPRLCTLLPTISKGRIKVRWCTACGQGLKPPYACPLDRYRRAATELPRPATSNN